MTEDLKFMTSALTDPALRERLRKMADDPKFGTKRERSAYLAEAAARWEATGPRPTRSYEVLAHLDLDVWADSPDEAVAKVHLWLQDRNVDPHLIALVEVSS